MLGAHTPADRFSIRILIVVSPGVPANLPALGACACSRNSGLERDRAGLAVLAREIGRDHRLEWQDDHHVSRRRTFLKTAGIRNSGGRQYRRAAAVARGNVRQTQASRLPKSAVFSWKRFRISVLKLAYLFNLTPRSSRPSRIVRGVCCARKCACSKTSWIVMRRCSMRTIRK